MAWRRTFEATEDGRFFFRPSGQFGKTYELPDKAAYNQARLVNWGLLILVFAFAIANLFHRQPVITIVAAVILIIAYYGWLLSSKPRWTIAEDR